MAICQSIAIVQMCCSRRDYRSIYSLIFPEMGDSYPLKALAQSFVLSRVLVSTFVLHHLLLKMIAYDFNHHFSQGKYHIMLGLW